MKVNLCNLKGVSCKGFCASENYKNECAILEKGKFMSEEKSNFKKLSELDLNSKVEVKGNGYNAQKYLSWSFAWSEFLKVYPLATYEVVKNENGLPYFADPSGAMVYVKVNNGQDLIHEMWLPVMNGMNKAMKSEPYTYTTRKGETTVEAYTMFDINKTVMRCLTKCLAMFGLGIYIYNGEDVPTVEQEPLSSEKVSEIRQGLKEVGKNERLYLDFYKVDSLTKLTELQYLKVIESINKNKEKAKNEESSS